jgi:hypothetical protein
MDPPGDYGPRAPAEGAPAAFRFRLPGFVRDEDVGLGDAIKRATSQVGISACQGCARRAALLNRWIAFARRGPP